MISKVDSVNQDADDVFEAVHAAMHALRSQQFRAVRDAGLDISHMESKALGFFARHPGATQRDLMAHSGRDKGQLARLIGGLKERGLLDAEPDPEDRRSQRLQLSAAGRAVLTALREQERALSAIAVDGMSDAERRQLLSLLDRLRGNLSR